MFDPCRECDFDWAKRADTLGLRVQLSRNPSLELGLRCPVCGAEYRERALLQHVGAVRRNDGIGIWTDLAGSVSIDGAVPLDLRSVLFEAVPVFTDDSRGLRVPDLPVRPAFLDLVNLDEVFDHNLAGRLDPDRGKYVADLPLIGRPARVQVELPVIGRQGTETYRPRDEAFQHVDISVWPDIRSDLWGLYIVDVEIPTAALDAGPDAISRASFAVVEADGKARAIPETAQRSLAPRPGVPPSRRKRFADLVKKRPLALGVTLHGDRYGGLFLPARARKGHQPTGAIEFGLDFGTSNTCIAFRTDQDVAGDGAGAKVPVFRDLRERLVGALSATTPTPGEQWVPRFAAEYYGDQRNILPSELLTPHNRAEWLGASLSAIALWRPGVDVAIPGSDTDFSRCDIDSNLIAELKWGNDAPAGKALEPQLRGALVRAYLKTAFVHTLAQIIVARERSGDAMVPQQLNVRFGYPGKWGSSQENELRRFVQDSLSPDANDAARVRWSVSEWMPRLHTQDGPSTDEAFAASRVVRSTGQTAGAYALDVLVDIGGGSADIAAIWVPQTRGAEDRRILEYLVSARYAGQDLFQALWGKGEPRHRCFANKLTPADAQQKIRSEGVQASLFDVLKSSDTQVRIEAFYNQLVEVLARFVAATLHNGQFERRRKGGSLDLTVRVFRLGSGWGMLQHASAAVDATIESRLERRLSSLRPPASEVRLYVQAGAPSCHPKHAVALGLLSEETQRVTARASTRERSRSAEVDYRVVEEGQPPPWVARTALGLDVHMETSANSTTTVTTIPWWLPAEDPTGAYPGVFGVDLKDQARYSFGMDGQGRHTPELPTTITAPNPDSVSGAVRGSATALDSTLDLGNGWFGKSPLIVLLETGLRNRLATLTKVT
jgi:hypothetical protein